MEKKKNEWDLEKSEARSEVGWEINKNVAQWS